MRPSRSAPLYRSVSHFSSQPRRFIWPVSRGYCTSCASEEPPTKTRWKTAAATNLATPGADHRELNEIQELFVKSFYSPGSPYFLPNGTRIFNKLVAFLRAQYVHFGFEEVITPTLYKKSLWEKSGHWDNYAENMFSAEGRGHSKDGAYGVKPMNCPGHCVLYSSKKRSYRELPVRYAEFGPLHRNEVSGALSGLTRVIKFHQDDGHIFCRPSQVAEEISSTLDFVRMTYDTFRLGSYRMVLSTRPRDNYIGTIKEWDNAEEALQQALEASGQQWSLNEGDGAFYGPKIDIILKDSDGKEHQTATIQLDFQLPKRFELKYEEQGLEDSGDAILEGPPRPVMIHRAVLGSVERFMALLIEHYKGHWPFWLNPWQIAILTINQDKAVVDYATKVMDAIQGHGVNNGLRRAFSHGEGEMRTPNSPLRARELDKVAFSVKLDDSGRPLGKKLVDARGKGFSIVVVVGKQDVQGGRSVAVDFTGIPNSQPLIKDLVQEDTKSLNRVVIDIERLRDTFLAIERAYL